MTSAVGGSGISPYADGDKGISPSAECDKGCAPLTAPSFLKKKRGKKLSFGVGDFLVAVIRVGFAVVFT